LLKAVIMDFDGVIVDTEVVWYNIYVDWFKKHKDYDLPVREFLACVGSNSDDLFDSLDARNIIVDRAEFARDTTRLFIEQSSLLPPKEGVVEFIHAVKSRGLKLALATSAVRLKIVKHLTRLGLIDQFDELITSEDVKRIKPYPDLFLKTAEKLGIEPHEALIIEDSRNGFQAGINAKMRVLVVPNDVTRYSDFKGCYCQLNSLTEINLVKLFADF